MAYYRTKPINSYRRSGNTSITVSSDRALIPVGFTLGLKNMRTVLGQ